MRSQKLVGAVFEDVVSKLVGTVIEDEESEIGGGSLCRCSV